MDRRITFARDSFNVLKDYLVQTVSKSVSLLRGNDEERVKLLAQKVSSDVSLLSDTVFQTGDFVDSDKINDLFDRIYAEYSILYKDMYSISENLSTVNSIFENSIFANVVHSITAMSKIKLLESMKDNSFVASDIYYDGLTSPTNYSSAKMKCAIDNTFGTLTLGYTETAHVSPETSDISISVLSGGVRVVDQNDENSMFSNVPSNPFFVNAVSSTNPTNYAYDTVDYSSEKSLLVDLVVKFPSAVPVTHISFIPFSIDTMSIRSIFYSTRPGAIFGSSDLRTIRSSSISQDKLGFSVSFSKVMARELHIVLSQSTYDTLTAQTAIDTDLTTIDKLQSIIDRLKSFAKVGFTRSIIDTKAIDEIRGAIVNSIVEKTDVLQSGTRIYTIGFYRLSASNRVYYDYGEYLSSNCKCDGNLTKIAFNNSGTLSSASIASATTGIIDTVTLTGVEVLGKRAYVGNTMSYGNVLDGFVVQQNRQFANGVMRQNTEFPYCVETHFPIESSLILSVNGTQLPTDDHSLVVVEDKLTTSRVVFGKDWCNTNGIYEGVVLCGSFIPKATLADGMPATTSHVNVEQLLGKPTVINPKIYNIHDSRIYVKDIRRSTADEPFYVGFSSAIPSGLADPGFIVTVVDGTDVYRLNQAKGLSYNNTFSISGVAGDIYSSSDDSIAVVSASGFVTAKSAGTTTINITGTTTGTVAVNVYLVDGFPVFRSVTPSTGIAIVNPDIQYAAAGWYPSIKLCTFPNDAFYTGIVGEPITTPFETVSRKYGATSDPEDDYITLKYRTATPYVKGSLRMMLNDTLVSCTEYSDDTDDAQLDPAGKRVFSIRGYLYTAAKFADAKLYYIPIDHSFPSQYYASNINIPNKTERFSATSDTATLSLGSISYLDSMIIGSPSFALQDGIFYYRNRYNVTYEPFIVTVNGIKAKNITDYRGDPATPPAFSTKTDSSAYEYYVKDLQTLVFDSKIKKANIVVKYYNFADEYRVILSTYKSNYRKDYLTPEITGITAIMNIQR